ncbi:MAG: NUDIX domain-containing protein [Candidatus Pacearchaeota archaeon]
MKEISAGAIVFYLQENKPLYLLLYKKAENNYKERFDFPKGNIETNEKYEEAAKREIREETGLDVKILPNFKEKLSWIYKRNNETIHKEAIFFIARSKTKDVKISFEHDGYEWLDFDEALKKLKFKNQKELLIKANEYIKNYLKQKKLY